MKVKIEIMYQGECVESREYSENDRNFQIPSIGDKIHLYYEDDYNTNEYGSMWMVKDRLFFIFSEKDGYQTVQLKCEPMKH